MLYRYCFPKKLGLDLLFTSRDLKNRIPRREMCIQSYSQVETPRYRPKYLNFFKNWFWTKSCFFNWFMGLSLNGRNYSANLYRPYWSHRRALLRNQMLVIRLARS